MMNVPCSRVAIGDYAYTVLNKEKGERERWTYSTVAALTKSSLDITLEYIKIVQHEDGPDMIHGVDAKIQVTKRDLIRIDASLSSSSPFLSILLNKEAASKVKICLAKLREMKRAAEGRDINYYSGESDSSITLFLTHPGLFMVSKLYRCFKNKVRNLSSKEASALLEQSKLSTDKILYDTELQLDTKFRNQLASRVKDRRLIFENIFGPCLQSAEMDISPSVLAHELRRISSFIHLFRDCGATKESFERDLKGLKNLDRFEEFMRSLHWRYEMIEEDMSARLQRCTMCPKPGFLKCSACMIKRYIGLLHYSLMIRILIMITS